MSALKRYITEMKLMRTELLRTAPQPDYLIPLKLGERELCVVTYALSYLRLAEEIAKHDGWKDITVWIGDAAKVIGEAMQEYEPDVDWDAEMKKVNDGLEKRFNAENN